MSDEQFLARWSRRKQEARAGYAEPAPGDAEANGPAPSEAAAVEPVLQESDLSHLPPIESIDAATDITAFLRKGIPQELGRAALRRAWGADPAIRDFVGLAENAWDFNDPNDMPGFGPLDYPTEQIEALVRRAVGGAVKAAESLPIPAVEAVEDALQSATAEVGFGETSDQTTAHPRSIEEPAPPELPLISAAPQRVAGSEEIPLARRQHGGALPR